MISVSYLFEKMSRSDFFEKVSKHYEKTSGKTPGHHAWSNVMKHRARLAKEEEQLRHQKTGRTRLGYAT